jgi:hypothetical protein
MYVMARVIESQWDCLGSVVLVQAVPFFWHIVERVRRIAVMRHVRMRNSTILESSHASLQQIRA